MALKTAGTSSTTVLKALQWGNYPKTVAVAGSTTATGPSSQVGTTGWTTDLAALQAYGQVTTYTGEQGIGTVKPPVVLQDIPQVINGGVHYPSRGILYLLPGDWVCVDPNTGWVTIVPANVMIADAGTGWTHS